MTKRPTMNDVAKLAGVSQATVSFVMNGKTDGGVHISEATQKRVLDAAATLNYRRNDAALALVTGRFRSIQLLISDVTDPFFDEFIHGIEIEALRLGYRVYLRSTQFSRKLERTSLADMQDSMVDGVIMCGTQLPEAERIRLSRDNRVVFVNDELHEHGGSLVVDDGEGYRQAMTFLAESGSHRLAFVSGSPTRPTSGSRLEAFRTAAVAHGHTVVTTELFTQEVRLEPVKSLIDRVERLVGTVDNVFCFNDVVAVSVMRGLRARGVTIPADIGVIGFDGVALARVIDPILTTIEVPRFELGRKAMLMLANMIGSEVSPSRETIVPRFAAGESHRTT